ncbi:MAG: ABC transporter ATP-binding protein/permease [Dehalococcoidia bacterium]|nr:ABC transporter ATP-binding protein/permease [Dehalococcoidia bacterium]
MRKLVKFLKPFSGFILLIFALLFVQALTDLSLPGYMSKIINVGVQQNGIESAVPDAVRQSEMSRLALFMSDSERAEVYQFYTLLDRNALSASDYNKYVKSYPVLESEPVYRLDGASRAQKVELDAIFSCAIAITYAVEQQGLASFLPEGMMLPPDADPFVFIAQLPEDSLVSIISGADAQMSSMPDLLVMQSVTAYLSGEYTAIGISLSGMQSSYMMRIGGLMLLLALLGAACSIAVGFFAARVAAGFARNVRLSLFRRVTSFSNIEFDKFSTASLITRSTNDIQQMQLVLMMLLRIVFYAPMLGIGGIIRAVNEDASMSWIIAAAVMALLAMIGVAFAIALPRFKLVQKLVDRLNLVTREILTGLMVIRAFDTQKQEEQKFDHANWDVTRVTLFINRVMVFMMPTMIFLFSGTSILITWVGAHQVDAGKLQIGNMMAFMQYAMQIIMAFLMVSIVFIMLPRAAVSAERIAEVLETSPTINDPKQPKQYAAGIRGMVEFKNVCFRYPGAEDSVLKNITFSARPGQTTAFVGSTGSGKSTLINLIPRFYDVSEGSLLVDGLDVREVTQCDLRQKIGYVPQKSLLFSGTIDSNVRYGAQEAAADEIEKAAQTAQALDFIKACEQGFETPVSEGATNFSGGQKQRLSIARALAKKAEIYIFDDTFSAIDYKTDAVLRKALKEDTADATVMIVAQRISTIKQADQIVVLDKGAIAGIGTHKELMQNCQVYRELALSQLSEEELAL